MRQSGKNNYYTQKQGIYKVKLRLMFRMHKGAGNMEYKGFHVKQESNKVIIENVRDFDPVHIFECGQCFRWIRHKDTYTGVAKGKVVNVGYNEDRLEIENASIDDFVNIWFDYFDLGRDYAKVKRCLAKDEVMKEAVKFGKGIRILRQDLWETLISFIISANNRIPKIMKTVEAISKAYGEEIIFDGKKYYSFPEVDKLAQVNVKQLEQCHGGYRCRYIVQTAAMVRDIVVDLSRLACMDTIEARNELMKFPGVGNKVADCTLLYSGTRYDVFPTDVWVKRVMEELYFKRNASFKEIQDFARERFGRLAGFAQQYLFYYARECKIGAKPVGNGNEKEHEPSADPDQVS